MKAELDEIDVQAEREGEALSRAREWRPSARGRRVGTVPRWKLEQKALDNLVGRRISTPRPRQDWWNA